VCTGSVIQACNYLLQGTGGKVSIFTTSLSSIGAGQTSQRNFPDAVNKPEEAAKLMQPSHDYF